MRDEVVEEVRRAREAYGERFGWDLAAIFRDIREQERLSGRTYVTLTPKRLSSAQATSKPLEVGAGPNPAEPALK